MSEDNAKDEMIAAEAAVAAESITEAVEAEFPSETEAEAAVVAQSSIDTIDVEPAPPEERTEDTSIETAILKLQEVLEQKHEVEITFTVGPPSQDPPAKISSGYHTIILQKYENGHTSMTILGHQGELIEHSVEMDDKDYRRFLGFGDDDPNAPLGIIILKDVEIDGIPHTRVTFVPENANDDPAAFNQPWIDTDEGGGLARDVQACLDNPANQNVRPAVRLIRCLTGKLT